MKSNDTVGIIVGRFQSPNLHAGHCELIEYVLKLHKKVIIFLGLSSVKCSKNNPLDFATRKAMIEDTYDIEISYIKDIGNNELWSKTLDSQISKAIGAKGNAILYGGRDSFISSYSGKYPTQEFKPTKIISARQIRKEVGLHSKGTVEFREGVIWAVENQYSAVHPTVDFAIINFKKNEVLLARKPNEELFRFPGGFADTSTSSYEDDVLRKAHEETGLTLVDQPIYIGSCLIDDWRYRSEQNKIKTLMFVVKYNGGDPVASDDVADIRWVKFDNLHRERDFVETHWPLAKMLGEWYFCTDLKRLKLI
jgi:bifunctional NMN adenylyltransferase/nudix hydrolase